MRSIIGKLKALYFILASRNFILIHDIKEFEKDGQHGHSTAYLRRTDYDTESDFYSMKASMVHQFGEQILDGENNIGDYIPK